jgi:phosphotransferase system HPr (HPr) family protein
MKTRQLIIQCEGGLHLRVAAQIVNEVQHHHSEVFIQCEGCPRANACSIFELLKLGASRGMPLEVSVEGPDEEATLQALSGVFDEGAGI